MTIARSGIAAPQTTAYTIVFATCFCHMLNDTMQSLLTSLYPLLKENYALDFVQIGLLTFAFQITASLLQPVVGAVTDRWPMPWSSPLGMLSTCAGLVTLANAADYPALVIGAALVGLGSAIFHPEASRMARMGSGGRYGFAQSVFQVGGHAGTAIGPLLAAFIVIPNGQGSLLWFTGIALVGFVVLSILGRWSAQQRRAAASRPAPDRTLPLPGRRVIWTVVVLVLLVASKNAYMASLSSYFTFYTIDRFGLEVQQAQKLLFLYLGASAVGVLLGGPVGDRYGARTVIWLSILGVIPFALMLPWANLTWTIVLVLLIGVIFSSAFSSIVVFAQELMPGRVGLVGGLFFGLSFGFGGLGAAILGVVADRTSIEHVYWICAFLPLLGLLTVFLPRLPSEMRR